MILFSRDPVTVKELSGFARRWQTYASRLVYLAFVSVLLFEFWRTTLRHGLAAGMGRSEYAELGRRLFFSVAVLQLFFVVLLSLSAAADLVTKEIRAGTLGVLSSTPLSPFAIAFGKWKAAMAQVVTLLLSGLPVMAISSYLGGVGSWDIGWSLSLTLALGMLGAALSLLCSSIFRSGTTALIVALVIYLAFVIVPSIFMARISFSDEILRDLSYVHPVYSAVMVSRSYSARSGGKEEYGWVTATLTSGAIAWILLRASAARIRLLALATQKPALLTRTMEAMDRFYEGLGPPPLRKVRLLGGGSEVWESHALLWKELRTRASGKLRHATRLALGLLLLIFVPLSLLFAEKEGLYCFLYLSTFVLLIVLGLASGVSLFVKEKEERKWDILLSTPMGTWEILRAKLLSGLVTLGPAAAFFLFLLGFLSWGFRVERLGTAMALGATALPVALAYLLGASASLSGRSMQAAFTISFAVLGLLLVAFPLGLQVYSSMADVSWSDDRFPFVLCSISHPNLFLDPFLDRINHYSRSRHDPFEQNLGYFLCYCVLYLGGCGGALLWMRLRFGRLTGRSEP